MNKMFYCEKCGQNYFNEEECVEHEKYCGKKYPVKCIVIENMLLNENENITFNVFAYPNAVLIGKDRVKLIPNSYHVEPVEINQLFLDEVRMFDEYIGMYTTNFSDEYEQECINKILEYRKNDLQNELKDYKESIELNIKNIERNLENINKSYVIKRNENCNQVIEERDDYY